MDALEPLHLDASATRLYLSLVEEGAADEQSLADRCALSPDSFASAVAELSRHGLLRHQDGELLALPPGPALERRADRLTAAARKAAEAARELDGWWSRTNARATYADFLRTGAACRAAELRVLTHARTQVRSLTAGAPSQPAGAHHPAAAPSPADHSGTADDRGPAGTDRGSVPAAEITAAFHEGLERGVQYRAIYDQSLLNSPASLDAVMERQRAGEIVRLCPELPVSMTIGDDSLAVAAYPTSRRDDFHSLLARPSGLLDLMIQTFEIFWRQALPLRRPHEELDDHDQEILTFLLCGITDAAIAGRLGISTRTVTRRVARMQEQLGVTTRFQLGLRAKERGWV